MDMAAIEQEAVSHHLEQVRYSQGPARLADLLHFIPRGRCQ